MELNDRVRAWKWLKSQLDLVRDKDLKNAMLAEFRKRAMKDWGYNPDSGYVKKQENIELDDWEKEFVEDIKKAKVYELDTRVEKREKEKIEAKARMGDFIEHGGKLSDLPDYLQNEHTTNLYLEVMSEKIDNCVNFLFTK